MARRVPDKTLEIQSKDQGRLSPDLVAVAEPFATGRAKKITFGYSLDRKKKALVLDAAPTEGTRLNFWRTGSQKACGLIALKSVLMDLGFEPGKLRGKMFDAKIDGTKIEIHF